MMHSLQRFNRLFLALVCALLFVCLLAGCSNQSESQDESTDATSSATETFDGSSYEDTGLGVMYILTDDGTSEEGHVPTLAPQGDSLDVEVVTEGMDSNTCHLYIDGYSAGEIEVGGEMTQDTISLSGSALDKGDHKIELVLEDGDAVSVYKLAQYKVA
ncbi:MAG: hypothetical protein ACOYCA_04315 [Eggerthellaceae bacterium]|jgi:hypothetical protein